MSYALVVADKNLRIINVATFASRKEAENYEKTLEKLHHENKIYIQKL